MHLIHALCRLVIPLPRLVWNALASLQLTMLALALLMALVVLCTLAQTRLGTYSAVHTYMRSLVVWGQLPVLPFPLPIFPGGVLVGLLLILNLSASLLSRFNLTWSRAGLWIAHAGLILLIAGEFATGAFQVETAMNLEEGHSVMFTESPRDLELTLTNTTNPTHDQIHAVPVALLRSAGRIEVPGTPITLQVKQFFENAALARRAQGDPPSLATVGLGTEVKVVAQPPVVAGNELNQTSAFVEPVIQGRSLGTWLVSVGLDAPQTFVQEGQTYALALRFRRDYLPYALTLKAFRHDVYPGTNIPKNFSSLVHVSHPAKGEERDVLISMNHPLRYEGRTFYQASFGKEGKLSILQVVQNPGWTLPYISCGLITLGLLLHFGLTLRRSLQSRRPA